MKLTWSQLNEKFPLVAEAVLKMAEENELVRLDDPSDVAAWTSGRMIEWMEEDRMIEIDDAMYPSDDPMIFAENGEQLN